MPFDAATFSYAYPLLGQVLLQGGISAEEEDALEQVALALAIIRFHSGECLFLSLTIFVHLTLLNQTVANAAFPWMQTIVSHFRGGRCPLLSCVWACQFCALSWQRREEGEELCVAIADCIAALLLRHDVVETFLGRGQEWA